MTGQQEGAGQGRALVCAPLPPEYDRESGSRRIYHMVEFLLEAGWTVAFVCESAPEDSRHLQHLRQRGVATFVGFQEATADLVEGGGFDLAIFAFWYIAHRYAHMVRRLSPDTRIIVESVDLHWLRNARRILGGSAGAQGELDEEYGGDLVAELNAYAAADAVLTVSDKEADLVNDITGVPGLARAVPDCDKTPPSALSFQERAGILFIGNFRHPPNLDAARFLCRDIMPLLPPLLRARHPLWIVGNALDGRVAEAAADLSGAHLVGWVPSLEPYLHAARASVIPLRYGAGTKRKAIQALLARTPSVATPVGVEGLDVEDGEHVLVAERAADFAGALERLLVDRDLWMRLGAVGRDRMLATHGREVARTRFLEAVGEVLVRPPRKRRSRAESGDDLEKGRSTLARVVGTYVPEGASVLVVSKGDPMLVDLPDRTARHFPQSEDGGYAGFHPRDSVMAIRHLEEVRGDAEYLMFPATSFWWLEYYTDFARHLASHHERVCDREDCVIYRLGPGAASPVDPSRAAARPGVHGDGDSADRPRRSELPERTAGAVRGGGGRSNRPVMRRGPT